MAFVSILNVNPLQPPVVDVEHNPLADKDFKISDIVTDFNQGKLLVPCRIVVVHMLVFGVACLRARDRITLMSYTYVVK